MALLRIFQDERTAGERARLIAFGIVAGIGAFGPYWMISDLVLVVLITIWLYEVILLKRPQRVQSKSFIPWFAPASTVEFRIRSGYSRALTNLFWFSNKDNLSYFCKYSK